MTLRSLLPAFVVATATFVGAAGCTDPVGGPVISEMTRQGHERFFPIAVGKHEEASCVACHGEEASFDRFTCLDCHEHSAELMDPVHQGFADYAFESARCLGCHPKGDILDEIDHSAFPIREGSAHDEVSCASCHTNPNDRATVGCTGCHDHSLLQMQPIHEAIPDYQWISSSCTTCHPGAIPEGLMEHPFFPREAGTGHGEARCADCHAAREDRQQLNCTSCHLQPDTDPTHEAVPEYLWESGSCFACHPTGDPNGALSHTFFPIDVGSAHETIGCADCHVSPATRADVGCTTCHESHGQDAMATVHAAIPDYEFDSPACLFCHPGGEPQGQIDHAPFFPIEPMQTHSGLSCRDCHADVTARERVACISCHDHEEPAMAQAHGELPGYQWDSLSCLACHPGGEPVGTVDHALFPIVTGAAHEGISCAECHSDRQDRSVVRCTSCHEVTPMFAVHDGIPSYAWQSADCVRCHDSAQPVGTMDHTAFFPIAQGDTHDEASCVDCHASREDRSQLSCATCHLQPDTDPLHTGMPEYLFESTSCFMCHPTGQPLGAIEHSFFPIADGSKHGALQCAECHANPSTRAELACTACHEHEQAPMDTVHTGVPGYEHVSTACVLCHPNSEPTGDIDHEPFFPIAAPAAHDAVGCRECHVDASQRSVVGCATCHASAEVDPVHTGVPGYAHDSPACVACHPRADNPGQLDHTPFFPIAVADTHGVVSCAACHASQTDRTVLSCATCHEASTTDPIHVAIAGYAHESAACLSCHPQGESTGAFDHTAFFPIATGDVHADVSCAECHVDAIDATILGCATCHEAGPTADVHTLVPGYQHASPACLTCHPYGEASGALNVDHEPIFPIAIGTQHDGIGCGECHLSGTDTSVNGCRECHEQRSNLLTSHQNVGEWNNAGGPLPSSDCKLCHAEAQVKAVATHGPFRISSGAHRGERCTECHDQRRADKPWAQDFEPWTCLGCHSQNRMDDKHSGENSYSYTNAACIGCHPTGRKD